MARYDDPWDKEESVGSYALDDPHTHNVESIDDISAKEEDDIKADAVKGMSARVGADSAPMYGALKQEGHQKLYQNWRETSGIPNLPHWHEMDNSAKKAWITSSHGARLVNQALRALPKSDKLGKSVRLSTTGDPAQAKRDAESERRTGMAKLVASGKAPVLDARDAGSIKSPFAASNDYSHHQKLGSVIDNLEDAHNGGNSSVAGLAEAARKSLSDSIYSQGLQHHDEAISHFTQAAGHTMRMAQAVNGSNHNAGAGSSTVANGMMEANTHLSNYRNMINKLPKVNQHL